MQLRQTTEETGQQERESYPRPLSLAETDRAHTGNPPTVAPQMQYATSAAASDKSKVGLQVFVIALCLVLVGAITMLGMNLVTSVLIALFKGIDTRTFAERLGLVHTLISSGIILLTGFVIGKVASRRAIIPGIICGHLAYSALYYGIIFPFIIAVSHVPYPPIFWIQNLVFTVLGVGTEIGVALYVARRRN